MSSKTNPSLTSMRKHLVTYNKMVRAETYKKVAKMKADQVREVFSRDFREVKSGKDGKTYYAPKNYDISLDSDDKFIAILKDLSKDLKQNKPQTKSEEPVKKKIPFKKKEVTADKKKAEPKKAEAPKKKPPFMKLKEDIDELKGIIKKSYEKNKEKLSKMTPKKYEDTIEKKLDTFIEDAREIYEDYNFSMSKTNMDDLEKYFFSVVPKKAEKKAEPKKAEPKKAEPKNSMTLKKLVSTAQSHKKNGISQEGLKAFNNSVMDFIRAKPPKNEIKVATQLYNYLYRNTFLGTKYMPKNLNKALTELNLKTF